jgi:hypothetical protein
VSAAGRGGPRIASDNYPTPAWATRRILDALAPDLPASPVVLEPCVGEGAITRVLAAYFDGHVTVIGCDVRETPYSKGGWDATKPLGCGFDLLITNPPFNLAHEIIQAQRDMARICCYLLRSSFIAGERAESYRGDMPFEYRLPERPEFIQSLKCKGQTLTAKHGCGWSEKVPMGEAAFTECPQCSGRVQRSTTDSTPYSWFVWTPQRRSVGRSIILPSTPLEERKALAA